MVKLEIINSSHDLQGREIIRFFKVFTLGNSSESDIVIDDPNVSNVHLKFEQVTKGIIISSFDELSYFSNGKKLSGSKLHSIGDTIKVGSFEFKITEYHFKEKEEVDLKELYAKNVEKFPNLSNVVSVLQDELLDIERESDV